MSAFVGELELHKATATIVGACVAACAAGEGSLWLLQDGRKAEGRRHPHASSCYCRCARLRSRRRRRPRSLHGDATRRHPRAAA